ncbi:MULTISPECIES: amino acid ABC transporter permease [Roseobacteraceae]|uniref:Glutamate/aspartate import permease protein GltK n=1 Tax=Pseudosulfitobacter pseudonitzschiae TaxID=1402135 RepID=A0A221K7Q6_9RHOB|nr:MULTISPECIES: amino acid ABC transporter permease [Roseobacteraceae]ASM75009.1 arginine transport system permease protein ArtQ [Pseudosulfitobacter pseudonitzschiae]
MNDFEWNFMLVLQYWPNFLRGILVTLELSAIVITAALVGGIFLGIARYSRNRWFNWPATAFIELFRNTPIFVQVVWFYYAFPVLIGIQMDGFTAALLGICLNMIAYTAEIYRGGIQSIHKGQWEAAKAIGIPYRQTMQRIILPQAIQRMIPAFANRMIEGAKATSLASAVAVGELLYQGEQLANTIYRPLEVYTIVAILYFLVIYPLALLSYGLEKRLLKDEEIKI